MQIKFFLAASAASWSLACGLVSPAYAQETTSTIRGNVTAAGAPVGGATVEIIDNSTGSKSSAITAPSGAFSVSGLRAGDSYSVSVSAAGFKGTQVTDIVTLAAQAYELPIDLGAQSDGDAIVVTATRLRGAGNVSQGPATVLNSAQIANVASINRGSGLIKATR